MLKALIFDVDGTLADTEMAHLAAFNLAFAEMGLDWHWDVPLYTRLLEVSGGKERIHAYWKSRGDRSKEFDGGAVQATVDRLHEIKTAVYEQAVQQGQVQMRPGALQLMSAATAAGMRLAIATTTSPINIHSLLKRWMGEDWRTQFSVIEDAATAPRKKPHPMVYSQTLQRLGLPAHACLAMEDSANGLKAACKAGLATVITTNAFTAHQDFDGALRTQRSLEGIGLAQLREWHRESLTQR
ncbi:MAG: HAD-IA family hydrolase [Pseudomonadota bacterium]|jgi:HAD superfamily hydrolase (TIGR01509 family)